MKNVIKLSDYLISRPQQKSARQIIDEVFFEHDVDFKEVTDTKRVKAHVSPARNEAAWRIRNELGKSYAFIAKMMGDKDHSTIYLAIKNHEKFLKEKKKAQS